MIENLFDDLFTEIFNTRSHQIFNMNIKIKLKGNDQ